MAQGADAVMCTCGHSLHSGRCGHFIARVVPGAKLGTTRSDRCTCDNPEPAVTRDTVDRELEALRRLRDACDQQQLEFVAIYTESQGLTSHYMLREIARLAREAREVGK